MSGIAYLDHNATSPIRPAAFDAMVEALRAGGNPSSVHKQGRAARSRVDSARRSVAALIGALPAEVVFTSGGTEANSLALKGAERKRVLVSAVECEGLVEMPLCLCRLIQPRRQLGHERQCPQPDGGRLRRMRAHTCAHPGIAVGRPAAQAVDPALGGGENKFGS